MNDFNDLSFLDERLNIDRRGFLKSTAVGAAAIGAGGLIKTEDAKAFAYAPYPRDDELNTVVTSCAHNCGSRHMLVAHKKGDVIVRISTDDGRYQRDGFFGKDTEEEPQIRGCLRGRSYRQRLYSPERLLYPMGRVGKRGEGKFKRISWEEALEYISNKMIEIKEKYGSTALLDQSYAGASYGVLHKSDQIEGLLGRFLGMFSCRTSSWSVPSYQGTTSSSRWTFGTIEDGNEDDAFADSKLMIMWGWNPAYTFHGGNTFYYLRLAKQRGCKFVLIDPQYTDSAACYDAWWIPIKPNTDAAMMAGMAHFIFTNNLQDQEFINRFCQGMDAGTMPVWASGSANGQENFKDYILGAYDGVPKTPEWAAEICGVSAEDIRKLAHMYATTKPAALKASWAPGRNAYGEQYNRMAAALQAMTGNIGILGGSAEGVGKAWHSEAVAYPYDEYSNIWFAAIKSDRWAHCVLNYPNVSREEIGLWPREDQLDGTIPNIKGIFWQGSDWFNQLTNINKEIEAMEKMELVVCMDSTITPSGLYADVLLPVATHFERHDVALPWYKGHYYIHRPKVIEPMGESKSDFQIFTELAYRIGWKTGMGDRFGKTYNPKADRSYFFNPDPVDEAYLREWWEGKVMAHQHVDMPWDEFKARGVYKFKLDKTARGLPRPDRERRRLPDAIGQDRDPVLPVGADQRLDPDHVRLSHPLDPQVDRALGVAEQPQDGSVPLPSDLAPPALADPFDLQQLLLAAGDLRTGGHHQRLGRQAHGHQDRGYGGALERAGTGGGARLCHRALYARCAGAARGIVARPRRERRRPGRQPRYADPRRAESSRRLCLQHRALQHEEERPRTQARMGPARDLACPRLPA